MSFFLEVFQSAFSPMVLFYMIAGVAAGICIGALPGLTATMGVALLLPLTFGMVRLPHRSAGTASEERLSGYRDSGLCGDHPCGIPVG